ncbi:MAG: glycosyltransferase family 4 protein [Herminiimonas sp.]|nr:glycosyltransferase family 4 protein [Herminiimonas sp.]
MPGRTVLHIFNGFLNPTGGSELEALSLYALLRQDCEVHLWATSSRVSRDLMRRFPIRRISLPRRQVPHGGTFIFVGAHWRNKLWPYLIARPDRLIYIYNTFHPKVVGLTSQMPRALGWPAAEYVLISAFQKNLIGLPGEPQVHPSPIDIRTFLPDGRERGDRVVVGRMSRDAPDKHDPQDLALYRELASLDCIVRLQGARCIAAELAGTSAGTLVGDPAIDVTAEGAMPPAEFLRSLDVFYYRSGVHVETFGRVVFEAMACARPVVCHRHGGYADAIRHGENGFLFETTAQARAILSTLIADPVLCRRVGAAARETVEHLYAPAAIAARLDFYRRVV